VGELRWSRQALRWLREIHRHIARDNPEAARRTVQGILDRAEILKSFPESGHRYEGRSERNVRILLYAHYRIAYLVNSDRDVQILGVFHGSLEIERHLS
jgi:toxin ParE1/3/4